MKYLFLFCLFFSTSLLFSQKKLSKEVSLKTDNDLYTSLKRDRYYTSGIFISYRYLAKNKNEKLAKKIMEWQIGHEMFTPSKAVVQNVSEHDRPFAANLYTSFGVKNIYNSNKIFNYSLDFGVIGKNAFGNELQDFIHDIYGFKKAIGWKYQIKNAINVNLNTEYISFLVKNKANTLDISWVNSARLGTVYTNFSTGFYTRFSFTPLQSMLNSIAFNTNLNNKNTRFKREMETFFYIKPTLRYSLYDATIEGSFLNKGSEVTKEIVPLVFNVSAGFKFTVNRFNFEYAFNYNTSKSRGLKYTSGNNYGSIIVNYLLF